MASLRDLAIGALRAVRVDGRALCLARVRDGSVHAIDDVCTHDGGALDQGELEDDEIECPRHGARFDVRTGAAVQLPAFEPVETHDIRVEGDEVQVGVEHR